MDLSFSGIPTGEGPIPTLQGFDVSGVQEGQRIGGARNRQYVQFSRKKFTEFQLVPTPDGKPKRELVTVEREMVKIVTPGDKNIVEDFAQEFHKREHWNAYCAFREGKTGPIGFPLDECEWVSPTIATELKFMGVHTREQLADASDTLCERVPNGYELREYARAICEASETNPSSVEVQSLKAQARQQQQVIEQLMASQAEMQEMLRSLSGIEPVGQVIDTGKKPKKKAQAEE